MKKLQQYKVSYVRNGEKVKDISLGQNVILEALSIYNNIRYKNGEYIEDIIKVIFKDGEQLENLKNGITYNEEKYIPLLTSPSMQKHEEKIGKKTYKMEYLFIKESKAEFRDILENILSLGKSKEWEGKSMSIVKDVTARLGLATSGTNKINYTPKFIVLQDREYTYKQDNYVAFTNGLDKVEPITPETHPEAYKHTMFDGSGLMSPKMAEIIQEQLGLNYNVDFAIVRGYNGLAIKGLCLKFDFMQYIADNYKGDIEGHFEKREDGYYVRDFWGDMQCINNLDLILTESQCKWAKNFSSMKEYLIARESFDNKYKTITNSLYITKTNKDPKKLKTHALTNYQLLNNLAITYKELIELAQPTIDYYKKLIDFDLDSIRLFLGDIAKDIIIDDDGIVNNSELSASFKAHRMLQTIGDSALKIKPVRTTIINMIKKKIRLLKGGKFYIEGGYKIIAPCPVTFCNMLMSGHRGDNGLAEKEFYIPTWASEKVTISRNPVACYQEIQKTILTDKLDKWCKDYTSEIIFFNQKDNTHMLMSGADEDGDGCLVSKSNILYNAVITPEKIFVNLSDGIENPKHIYSRKQRWENEVLCSGNLIGKIANSTVIINSIAQTNYYYKNDHKYSYFKLRDIWGENKLGKEKWEELNEIWSKHDRKAKKEEWIKLQKEFREIKKEFNKALEKSLKKGTLVEQVSFDLNKQKELITEGFFDKSIASYQCIQLSMQAIDAPKTLRFPGEEDLSYIEKWENIDKPYFMKFNKDDIYKVMNYNSSLDKFAKYVGKELKYDIDKINDDFTEEEIEGSKEDFSTDTVISKKSSIKSNKTLLFEEIDKAVDMTGLGKLNGRLMELISNYNKKSSNGKSGKDNKLQWNYCNPFFIRNFLNISEDFTDLECLDLFKLYSIKEYREAIKNIEYNDILRMLKIDKSIIKVNFLFDIAWDTIDKVLTENYKTKAYAYIEDPNGEIDWMFKKYSKIDTRFKDNNLIDKDRIAAEKRLGGLNKIGFKKTEEGIENYINVYTRLIFTREGFKLNEKLLGGFYEIPDLEDGQEVEVVEEPKIRQKSVHIVYKLI